MFAFARGCFLGIEKTSSNSIAYVSDSDGQAVQNRAADFSASNSSTVFNGSKMQPSALQVLACIRI